MAVPRGESPGPPSFALMFAPLFFGVVFNAMLLGVFIVQVHSYFRLYKTDFAWIRYLIYYLIVMEIVNTICDVGLIYEPLISLHNSPLVTVNAPTLLAADPIVTSLISTPTQLFMAWRIRMVTKSRWLALIIVFLAFTSLVASVAATANLIRFKEFSHLANIEGLLALWLTSMAFADLFITAFLVNFLWTNKTGFRTRTDSVVDKIIFFTVQTGTLTSFAAIADISVFLLIPNTSLQFIWDFSLSKLYSICLISTLIARKEWNNLLEEMPLQSDSLHSPDAIIKVRRATDVQGLQLYVPEQFEVSANPSPRRRTPHAEWLPRPLPLPTKSSNTSISSESDRIWRTADWAMSAGR